MTDRERLADLLRTHSIRYGQFKLASGLESTVYCDGKLTTCRAEAMPLVGRCFLEVFRRNGWQPKAVGGLVIGADPIVISIAAESNHHGAPIDAFLIRKESKGHGTRKFLEGIENVQDMPVVMIDDVCTTGGSTDLAIERALEAGMKVLGAVCLVDREQGAPELFREKYGIAFDSVFRLTELTGGRT